MNAGLSIRALAERAGVAASTITRAETQKIDPTFEMVQLLLAAAEQQLVVSIEPLPTKRQVTLADLNDAWYEAPYGDEPDWTRLRSFLDRLARHPDMVAEAIQLPPLRSGSAVMDTLLAGIAEKLSADASEKAPKWTHRVPRLEKEWAAPATPRMLEKWRAATPPELLDRGLVIDEGTLWRTRNLADV